MESSCRNERQYIVGVLLGEFLGLDYNIEYRENRDTAIVGEDGQKLYLADAFFQTDERQWLTPQSLPREPLDLWNPPAALLPEHLQETAIPILYGRSHNAPPDVHNLSLDIFGSAFFMLSRYEELVLQSEDPHGRFPAAASLAYRNGFIDRPIVNEYLEILWACLKRLWPGLKRKRRQARVIPTHDVDMPYAFLGQPLRRVLVKAAVDLYHGSNLRRILRDIGLWARINAAGSGDPYDTFGWIMDTLEKSGMSGSFNFMAGGRTPLDYYYRLESSGIRNLIAELVRRGHEVGFHPSYKTPENEHLWISELKRLKTVLDGVPLRGGRQHFLRFRVPDTWRYWADSGLEYDSTLGFAEHAGFRCGTCYEYPVYDLKKRREIGLRERPLVAMDTSVIGDRYMGLGPTREAIDYLLALRRRCRRFNGDYVFLWHNQRFVDPREKEIYRALIN
jgi:hypothetical protein